MPAYRMLLATRGIPGVQSESYHMGYFEYLTTHRTAPDEHSDLESLIQTMGIYALLLLGFFVLSAMLFGIREYTWSLNRRRKLLSNGSAWSNRSVLLSGEQQKHQQQQLPDEHMNRAYPALSSRRLQQDQDSVGDTREGLENDIDLSNERLDVVRMSPNQSTTSLNTWTTRKAKSGNINRLVYTSEELLCLRPSELNGVPLMDPTILKPKNIEDVIVSTMSLQPMLFKNALVAEHTIGDICLELNKRSQYSIKLNDSVSRMISIMRLLSIASNCVSMENGNVFLPAFNEAIDFLVDTGAIFELLNEMNAYMARGLIEMVLQYCYTHFLFGEDRDPKILEQMRIKWRYPDPIPQNHTCLTRLLINIQLGLYTVKDHLDEETIQMTKNKSTTLLKHITQHSTRSDPRRIIPILRQAVEFSEDVDLHILCYTLLLKLIQLHLHDDSVIELTREHNDLGLKYLLQLGLWVHSHHKIRAKTEKVFKILVKKMPSVQGWWDEVKGGKLLVYEAPHHHTLIESPVEEKPMRPGSWRSSGTPKK